ncbi:MAG: hypothetical protein ABSG62_05350 [Terracidiphilus sp.]|jgi:hypothetical protein
MSEMVAIKKVALGEHHLRPGRTKHTLVDSQGQRDFPLFTSLVVAQYPGDSGYYLLHLCEDGQGTDTWHATLDDALHQAEYEFEVKPEDWV